MDDLLELADGRIASVDKEDDTVHIWHPDRPEATAGIHSDHTGGVSFVLQTADGRIASASTDRTVRLWDPDEPGITLDSYTGHLNRVLQLVELRDGRIASRDGVGQVHLWHPDKDSRIGAPSRK